MAPPKDIARSYPKRGLTVDVGFRSEPKFCGDGSTDFDGTADKVTAAIYNPSGDFLTTTAWVNANSLRAQGLIHNGNAGRNSFLFYMGSASGNLLFYWNDTTGDAAITHQINLVAGQWYHLAAVMDMRDPANHQVTYYIDGIAATGTRTSASWVGDGSYQFGNQYASAGWFNGKIANCRIYDAALTQDQIRELYNNPGLDVPTGLVASNLRRHYKLETDFNDSGADSENATASGSPSFTVDRPQLPRGLDLTGNFNSPPLTFDGDCVSFDGSTQGASSATSYSVATSGARTTLACWVYPRDLSGSNRTMVGNCVNNATDNMALYQTHNNEMDAIVLYGSGTSVKYAIKNVDPNRWYFLAATFDYDTTTFKFYVDGIEFSETPSLGYGGTAGLFEMGYRDNFGTNIAHLNGNLAHVMMIEDVLTQGEIVELMRDTTYAKAQTFGTVNRYYELNADFNDDTGSHNATSVGSPTFITTAPANPTRMSDPNRGGSMARVYTGRAVEFDGSADYLLADSSFSGAADFSYSAWVNLDSNSGTRTIVGENSDVTIYLYNNKIGVWNLWGTLGAGEYAEKQATNNAPTGRWVHIGVSYTYSSNTLKLYIDGIDQPTVPSPVIGPGSTLGKFEIGARDNGGSPLQFLDGKVAGVKRFNVALTQAQVRELYHNPEQVLPTGVSASNLLRYYPLSDYNDPTAGGMGGRYFQDMGADGEPAQDKGSSSMVFAQPVPCPQLGLQQSATRLFMNGSSSNKATVTLPSAPGSSFSFQLWVNMKSVNSSYALEYGNPSAAGAGMAIRIVSGTIGTYDTGAKLSGLTISNGEWAHIVMATSDSSPYWRCWVNGSEASSPAALTGVQTGASTAFTIGASPTFSYGTDGIISNCAFWTTRLDTPDVAALYNSGDQNVEVSTVQSSSLVGWWKCDDFTKFKNYANPGTADATVAGAPIGVSFPENASGSTIVGDFSMKRKSVSVLNPISMPVNSLIRPAVIPNDGSLTPDPSKGGYSFSAFIRFEQASGASPWKPAVFSVTTYWASVNRVTLSFGDLSVAAAPPVLTISDGTQGRGYAWPSALSNPEEWHQLAFTIDYTTSPYTTFKLYLDGALVKTQSTHVHTAFSPGDFIIGSSLASGTNFPGAIACFRMYQAKLSDNEMEQVYRSDLRLIKGLENE